MTFAHVGHAHEETTNLPSSSQSSGTPGLLQPLDILIIVSLVVLVASIITLFALRNRKKHFKKASARSGKAK